MVAPRFYCELEAKHSVTKMELKRVCLFKTQHKFNVVQVC